MPAAVSRIDAVITAIWHKCSNVFGKHGDPEPEIFESSVGHKIQQSIDNRYNNKLWLAGDDPVKINELDRLSALEYFLLLDKKIAEVLAQQSRANA